MFVFVHAASEDGVVACTREILVFFSFIPFTAVQRYVLVLNKLQEYCTRKKFKVFDEASACAQGVLRPGTSINHSLKVDKGEGINFAF